MKRLTGFVAQRFVIVFAFPLTTFTRNELMGGTRDLKIRISF
jgi:hypothetical protein